MKRVFTNLRIHLEACPECRKYLEQMQALLHLVDNCPLRDEADEASQAAVEDSLWPSLSTQLVSLPAPRHDRFNGWIPAVAVAAVCFAMVLVASPPQSPPPQSTPSQFGDGRGRPDRIGSFHAPTSPSRWPQHDLRIDRVLPSKNCPWTSASGSPWTIGGCNPLPSTPGPGSFFGPDDLAEASRRDSRPDPAKISFENFVQQHLPISANERSHFRRFSRWNAPTFIRRHRSVKAANSPAAS